MSASPRSYAIPMLPTHSINTTVDFYEALGFEVTYRQKVPNAYAAVKSGDIELHFFVIKDLVAANNFCTCYLIVYEIDLLYAFFSEGLKKVYGKIPIKGYPRMNPLRDIPSYGVRQFIVVDPSGNYVRIGKPIKQENSLVYKENNIGTSGNEGTELEKAYELGFKLTEGKGDLIAASRILDKAIKLNKSDEKKSFVKILILRADIALRTGDISIADELLLKAESIIAELNMGEIADEFRLLEELRVYRKNI